ncbi:MAG: type Z 30S ribosomal protein S14 [Planctomycetota bacterium]
MSRLALKVKQRRTPKFKTRAYNRCQLCGRARSYYRKLRICRLCLRDLAHKGEIPGMKKASW